MKEVAKLTIGLDLQTGHMKNMLKAIAKHANELANEIDTIQNTTCPRCGEKLMALRVTPDKQYVFAHCGSCDEAGFYKAKYFAIKDLPEQ